MFGSSPRVGLREIYRTPIVLRGYCTLKQNHWFRHQAWSRHLRMHQPSMPRNRFGTARGWVPAGYIETLWLSRSAVSRIRPAGISLATVPITVPVMQCTWQVWQSHLMVVWVESWHGGFDLILIRDAGFSKMDMIYAPFNCTRGRASMGQ